MTQSALIPLIFGLAMLLFFLLLVGVVVYVIFAVASQLTGRRGCAAGIAALGVVVLLALMLAGMFTLSHVQVEPQTVEVDVRTDELEVEALKLEPRGTRNAAIIVEARNVSDQAQHLGLSYYADGGVMAGGFYSPGASSSNSVKKVDPGFAGELVYEISTPRFVRGGEINIILAAVDDPEAAREALAYPPSGGGGAEALFQHRFGIGVEEERISLIGW